MRQKILETGDILLYALATLLSYDGLRIGYALIMKLYDISLQSKKLIVKKGKGGKQRIQKLLTHKRIFKRRK